MWGPLVVMDGCGGHMVVKVHGYEGHMVEEEECRVTWWWRWLDVGLHGRGG